MSSLFRSTQMSLVRLYFDRVAAHDTVDELALRNCIQFVDLNAGGTPAAADDPKNANKGTPMFQRSFALDVKKCDEMQRRLRFLENQAIAAGWSEADLDPSCASFDAIAVDGIPGASTPKPLRLQDLEAHLAVLESNMLEMNEHWEALRTQYDGLLELKNVLEKGAEFFQNSVSLVAAAPGAPPPAITVDDLLGIGPAPGEVAVGEALLSDESANTSAKVVGPSGQILNYYLGAIPKEKVAVFERVLFRATRGNCVTKFSDIDPDTTSGLDATVLPPRATSGAGAAAAASESPGPKCVFGVFFAGAQVKLKVEKICAAFGAKWYPFPEEHPAQMKAYADCRARLKDLATVLETTAKHRIETLRDIAANLPTWKQKVYREKLIFHTLNMFNYDTSHKLFIAEGWCPSDAIDDVQAALDMGRRRSNAQVPSVLEERPAHGETPPTYFKTNKFTQVFQSIVESYGVAQYQEVNPAPFAIITFPFLFAVMFGDVGHGIVMALFALYLIFKEKQFGRQKLGEMAKTMYDGRYIIFLMGLFSIYTGFIYNEFFAVPLNIFGSRWKYTAESLMACGIDNCVEPAKVLPPLKPYPFGFDPAWKSSMTGLLFFNSYKMKLSIILGVTQMTMGICLSYVNARFFKEPIDVFFVFLPQLIFLLSIFGYLCFVIVIKWGIDWNGAKCLANPNCVPPDIKAILIGMFMSPGSVPAKMKMFRGQAFVQVVLLLVAFICVPWMLFPKPFLLRARHRKKTGYAPILESGAAGKPNTDDEDSGQGHGLHGHEKFNFGDVFVHQCIHTIEFVLGAVSNTASYLRLWALSLAHAQLSDVFLEKLLYMTFETGHPIAIIIGFFMWIGMTVGVLMLMESLSAFLHTLRLHWVEFMNKFYNLHGPGRKFIPFNYTPEQND